MSDKPVQDRTFTLAAELRALLNRESRENASGTPDFILASFMIGCLEVYERTAKDRDAWYGFKPMLGTVPAYNANDPHHA